MSDINKYFLKKRQTYSEISSDEIRQSFELRMLGMGYTGDFLKAEKGTYADELLQIRWEEYVNGFRQGEDSQK